MRFAFRVDASLEIGTGHVMRCLALAQDLRNRGMYVQFICREHPGDLIETIRKNNFEVVTLGPNTSATKSSLRQREVQNDYSNWLGIDWEVDAQQTKNALLSHRLDWLIVDHYGLDTRWESALRTSCDRVMVIDDLANRTHDCDLLLDPNPGRKMQEYANMVPRHCMILTGPQYALLRPEFATLRDYSISRRKTGELKKILVSMGGVDNVNATGAILDVLRHSLLAVRCDITVVMGYHAPWLKKIQDQALTMSCPTRVCVGVKNMAELMAESDLAIGAAGGTALERCCLGLPSLIIAIAENQYDGAKALAELGAAYFIEDVKSLSIKLADGLAWMSSPKNLREMQGNASVVCDGYGVSRVLNGLMQACEPCSRAANPEDELLLLQYANDPIARQNAFDVHLIEADEHRAWLSRKLAEPDQCRIFIIEIPVVSDKMPIGQVRFERRKQFGWEISYSLDPKFRGLKLGRILLQTGILGFHRLGLEGQIFGKVKASNLVSRRVFETLGFRCHLDEDRHVMMYIKQLKAESSGEGK